MQIHEIPGLCVTDSPRPAARIRPLPDLHSKFSAFADRSARSIWFGLRACHQPGKPTNFPGIPFLPSTLPVLLDQQLAIDPCCPSVSRSRMSPLPVRGSFGFRHSGHAENRRSRNVGRLPSQPLVSETVASECVGLASDLCLQRATTLETLTGGFHPGADPVNSLEPRTHHQSEKL